MQARVNSPFTGFYLEISTSKLNNGKYYEASARKIDQIPPGATNRPFRRMENSEQVARSHRFALGKGGSQFQRYRVSQ